MTAEGADTVAAEVAAVLGDDPELAAHIRDARSNEDPCPHWVGQSLAVCAPCLRDRLAPHVGRLVADHLHARHAAALDEARAEGAAAALRGLENRLHDYVMPSEVGAAIRAVRETREGNRATASADMGMSGESSEEASDVADGVLLAPEPICTCPVGHDAQTREGAFLADHCPTHGQEMP